MLKEERMEMDEMLVSFDVTSLSQMRQLKSYIENSWKRGGPGRKDPTITGEDRRAPTALKSTYFSYNGNFYERGQGLPTCTWSSLRSWPYRVSSDKT